MKRFILAAGVAALAVTAPAAADPGKNKGGGGNKGHAAHSMKGGPGQQAKVRVQRSDSMKKNGQPRYEAAKKMKSESFAGGNKAFKQQVKAEKKAAKQVQKMVESRQKAFKQAARNDVRIHSDWDDRDGWNKGRKLGFNEGCPPGLLKQNAFCLPPGQLKNGAAIGRVLPVAYSGQLLPLELRDLYSDNDDYYYRYGDGYVYRVDRDTNLISSLLPLLGAGLGVGQVFPTSYMNSYVPKYYSSFYPDTQDDYYRFANGYVYEIDRDTGRIEDMIPLMANGYGVGQMLPIGYSAYNVPYQYRSLYSDGPNANYRYAPGAIYQVDPTTQLITAVASLLAPNAFNVGQRLPMGYSTYNVPVGYRDQYFDTADNWYRYNNGSIYRVDPTTQLITAVIRAIV